MVELFKAGRTPQEPAREFENAAGLEGSDYGLEASAHGNVSATNFEKPDVKGDVQVDLRFGHGAATYLDEHIRCAMDEKIMACCNHRPSRYSSAS